MALKSTVFKADVQIADLDRHYYAEHKLTLARHPSENDRRMMVRLAVFCLHADESLAFSKGLCVNDEPELWQKSFAEDILLWIDLGQVDHKRVKKACSRARKVLIYTYQHNSADVWWQQNSGVYSRYKNLRVVSLAENGDTLLEDLVERSMQLQCTIQDGAVWLSNGSSGVEIQLDVRQAGEA